MTYRQAIQEKLVPSYRRLQEYLVDSYVPKARTTAGYRELPNGRDWYRYLVRHHTTTSMTPDEIHEVGLAEVARIHKEMERIKEQIGLPCSCVLLLSGRETELRAWNLVQRSNTLSSVLDNNMADIHRPSRREPHHTDRRLCHRR